MPFNGSTWIPYDEFSNGSIADMGAYGNDVSGGAMGAALLIILYVAILVAVGSQGKDELAANACASFVVWVSSIFMVAMQSSVYNTSWLPQEALYLTSIIMAFSLSILYFERK